MSDKRIQVVIVTKTSKNGPLTQLYCALRPTMHDTEINHLLLPKRVLLLLLDLCTHHRMGLREKQFIRIVEDVLSQEIALNLMDEVCAYLFGVFLLLVRIGTFISYSISNNEVLQKISTSRRH